MTRSRIRSKDYGLGRICYGVVLAVCFGILALMIGLFDVSDAVFETMKLIIYLIFGGLLFLDMRLTKRQTARDLEVAKAAIRRPLRNAVFGPQEPIDFDAHFPTVSPNGGIVSAIDPKRRTLCWIACRWIDKEGNAVLDGGRIDGTIADVTETKLPLKRRWFGLLSPKTKEGNVELSVTVIESKGDKTTMKFQFRPDDQAAVQWRRTFEQWMYEDRQVRA